MSTFSNVPSQTCTGNEALADSSQPWLDGLLNRGEIVPTIQYSPDRQRLTACAVPQRAVDFLFSLVLFGLGAAIAAPWLHPLKTVRICMPYIYPQDANSLPHHIIREQCHAALGSLAVAVAALLGCAMLALGLCDDTFTTVLDKRRDRVEISRIRLGRLQWMRVVPVSFVCLVFK